MVNNDGFAAMIDISEECHVSDVIWYKMQDKQTQKAYRAKSYNAIYNLIICYNNMCSLFQHIQ